MIFDKELYLQQLQQYNFSFFPRCSSNPFQNLCRTYDDFFLDLLLSYGKNPCFISHNGYPHGRLTKRTKKRKGKMIDGIVFVPDVINVGAILFDLDCSEKPENAFADLKNLDIMAEELELDCMFQYSGGKGFHFIILLKPTNYRYLFREFDNPEDNEQSADSLKEMVEAIQSWFCEHCNVRTFDPHLNSDVKRVIRCPWTLHVTWPELKVNGRVCFPLTRQQVREWSMQDVINYASSNPVFHVVNSTGGTQYRMEELISFLGAKPKPRPENKISSFVGQINDAEVEDTLSLILYHRGSECIWHELRKGNPNHHARIFFVLFVMRYLNLMQSEQINNLWEKFGKVFGYADLGNYDYRMDQIESICETPKYMSNPNPHTCSTLKKYGLCIGKECKKYFEV